MAYEDEPKIIHEHINVPDIKRIDVYEAHGGYAALRKALSELSGDDVLNEVKTSGLRGRGGAGFPTGMKWSFMPKPVFPKYLVCNCDESEPGTFSNREIILKHPHLLLEGFILGCYAIGCNHGYFYIRGEFYKGYETIRRALAEAKARGYVGKNILGSGFDLDITLHIGAGAYICGEETALLSSLEGDRGQPRLKPPFPAVAGLYAKPTSVNNVETLCNVPFIINNGAAAFRQWGTEKSPGMKIVSVSGHVNKPGNYELPLGTPIRDIIYKYAAGVRGDKPIKGFFPGGSSTPILSADKLDVTMDFEAISAAGSLLGTAALIVFDEDTDIVAIAHRLLKFYKHESCGKCTPCREGNDWLVAILGRLAAHKGKSGDADVLVDMASNIAGRSFCPLGDAAATPVLSSIKNFREDYEKHITNPTEERIFIPVEAADGH
jgi:NADH-quinone oxidoreductase subunit F